MNYYNLTVTIIHWLVVFLSHTDENHSIMHRQSPIKGVQLEMDG